MFCTQCGAVINDEQAMFCPQCGSPTKRADQMPYSESLSKKPETLNQRSAVRGGSENNTEILDTPFVMNHAEQKKESSSNKEHKTSGVMKWILIGVGAFIVVLIIVIGVLIGVLLPRAKNTDTEIAGQDEHQEITPEELDNIIASVDTEEPESEESKLTETEAPELTTTEAPLILASELIIDNKLYTIVVGDKLVIPVSILPSDVTNPGVEWRSDNPEIAEIDADGNIVGKSFGSTSVYCSTIDGSDIVEKCEIMVVQTPSQRFVSNLYVYCLSRSASADEIQSWADVIESGTMSPAQVAASFCKSEELNESALNNEEFVKIVYRTYLNREYDQAGLDNWVNLLNDGMSRDDMLAYFANESEFHQLLEHFGLE